MDFSKIKLIVSDMDGTLLNSHEELSELFLQQFDQLQELGVEFVAASGRQYNSIVKKLHLIKDKITIIAENGAIAKRQNEQLLIKSIDPEKLENVLPILREIPNIFIIFCGETSAFIDTRDPELINMFREYYGTHQIVSDLTDVAKTTPILKIALFHPESSEDFIYPKMRNNQDFLIKISGKNWLDLSDLESNKGNALKVVQKRMDINPEETLVFGDYMNDLEMLEQAYFSYAMENAHPDVKKVARFETKSNNDFGVENILSKVIESKRST